jgi:activator of HSP90 ATPase
MKAEKVAFAAFLACIAGLALLASQSGDSATWELFQQWKAKHGQVFSHEHDRFRLMIFQRNLREIEVHNAQANTTYTKGLNRFSALTREEFQEKCLSRQEPTSAPSVATEEIPLPNHKSSDLAEELRTSEISDEN